MEKTVKKNMIYDGKILKLYRDDALSENDTPCIREYVRHSGGVCVLALVGEDAVFVEQYRYAIGRVFLELPAGKLEPGENPYDAGLRELEEETGFKASELISLGTIIPTVGYSDEVIHLYLARGLKNSVTRFDEDELISLKRINFRRAVEMALSGEITDAKSVALLLRANAMIEEENK